MEKDGRVIRAELLRITRRDVKNAIALYQRRWRLKPVRQMPLERSMAKIEQLPYGCVIVLPHGFLTSVCGIYKAFLLYKSPTASTFQSLAHHLFTQYRSYGLQHVFTVGLMHDPWPLSLSEPIKYLWAISIVVQENLDRYFKNTVVLPNLPDVLHY